MSNREVIGVWYRSGPGYKPLHVARWIKTEGGAVVESACGGLVISPNVPDTEVALLAIPKTTQDALRSIQPQQSAMLCRKCRALFSRR
jgi:hypothetical protein